MSRFVKDIEHELYSENMRRVWEKIVDLESLVMDILTFRLPGATIDLDMF